MLTTQERIDNLTSPIAKQLLQNLHDALAEAIVIPNSLLPEEFHRVKEFETGSLGEDDGKIFGATIAQINEQRGENDRKKSDHKLNKEAKAERIEKYREMWEDAPDSDLQFIEDDARLYRQQVTFCKLAIQAGWMTDEEFEED